jgi:long-chain acyl-CoA synthetase
MKPQTLNDIFFAIARRKQERVMLVREASQWVPISSQELYRKVAAMARELKKWGLIKGDRLAILSENRPEWAVADFASLLLGAVVVPIYATLTAQQTAYILCDSGARIVVVSSAQQLGKVLSIKDQTAVEKVVVMDAMETPHATADARRFYGLRCRSGSRCAHDCRPRSGIDHLHLGNYGYIQGCATESW